MRIVLTFFLLASFITVSFAQIKPKAPVKAKPVSKSTNNFKIGYVFEDYIFENYEEVKKMDVVIKKKQTDFQEAYNVMAIDYQTKYLEYQESMKNLDSMTTEKLNDKLKNVQNIKARADDFQRQSEKEIQGLTGDGIAKMKENINDALKLVAKEKNYPFVLNRNKTESLYRGDKKVLYYNDKGMHNLSDAVLMKLGSKPPVPVAK